MNSEETESSQPEENRQKLIIFRGHSEGYRLAFVGIFRLKIEAEEEKFVQFNIFATEDNSKVYNLDFNSSDQVENAINELGDQPDQNSDQRDTRQLENKFRKNFDRSGFLASAGEILQEEDREKFKQFFKDRVENKIFPGSDCQMEMKIFDYQKPQKSTEQDPVHDRISENISQRLEVKPYINPSRGKKLEELDLNRQIFVRVVGESVQRLNPALKDESSPEDSPFSRPLPARLEALKVGPSPGEMQFWVNFKEDVYGEGKDAKDIRVGVYEQEHKKEKNYKQLFFALGVFVLILFTCFFFLFIGFPQYFFYLFF